MTTWDYNLDTIFSFSYKDDSGKMRMLSIYGIETLNKFTDLLFTFVDYPKGIKTLMMVDGEFCGIIILAVYFLQFRVEIGYLFLL